MSRTIIIANNRVDTTTATFFTQWYDAVDIDSISLLLSILSLSGTITVSIIGEHTTDPNNPNAAFALGSSVAASSVTSATSILGGLSSGTSVPVGPWVRFKVVITSSGGMACWNGVAVMRG